MIKFIKKIDLQGNEYLQEVVICNRCKNILDSKDYYYTFQRTSWRPVKMQPNTAYGFDSSKNEPWHICEKCHDKIVSELNGENLLETNKNDDIELKNNENFCNMIYCEGKNCLRRDQCAYHESFKCEHPRQVRDCSTEGISYGPFYDENNKAYMKSHWDCGDNADNYYSHYKALGWREGQDYRNSAGTICDEVCLTCPHQDMCFSILELAGMTIQPGDRIRFNCESIKQDPEGYRKRHYEQLKAYYSRLREENKK